VTIHDSVPAPIADSDNLPLYQPDEPSDAALEITQDYPKIRICKGDTITLKNLSK
jgi:hypothetical protein